MKRDNPLLLYLFIFLPCRVESCLEEIFEWLSAGDFMDDSIHISSSFASQVG